MKFKILLFLWLITCSKLLIAGNYELYGTVLAYDSNGNEVPLDKIHITAFYNGLTQTSLSTNKNGDFKIPFPKNKNSSPLEAGVKVNFRIEESQWTILSPRNGEVFIPRYANNERIEIFVIANESTISLKGLKAQFKIENQPHLNELAHYTIQVLSTHSKTRATLAKQEFELANYKVDIKKIKSKYRVTVGAFNNWIDAQQHSDIIRNSFSHRYDDCFVKPSSK